MMLKLIIEDDENQIKVVRLLRDEITIGRKEGNTIRLTERNVSRKHARLFKKDDEIFLEDLGSYNGLKVNGIKISDPIEIDEGDKILIGDYTLMLKMDEAEKNPFEEMATIPVERLDQSEIDSANNAGNHVESPDGVHPDSPTVPIAVQDSEPLSSQDQIPSDKQAKIVVLTSSFQGTSFNITKNTIVLGRNRENDVFIDHQSLSAIHAKIEFDGFSYSIEDLGSKNGIRINGDDCHKMTLRKGDIIDLGHVRIRFVAPGEVYNYASESFNRDGTQSGNKKTLFIALGLVALAGLIFIFLFSSMFGKKKKSEETADTNKVDIVDLLKQLDTLKDGQKWDDAINRINDTLKIESITAKERNQLRHQLKFIKKEQEYQKKIVEIEKLLQNKKWADVLMKTKSIPKTSFYFSKGSTFIIKAKTSFLQNAVKASKTALEKKECTTIATFIKESAPFHFSKSELAPLNLLGEKCSNTKVANNAVPNTMKSTMTSPVMSPSMKSTVMKPVMKTSKTMKVTPSSMKTNSMKSKGGEDDYKAGLAAYRSGSYSRAVRKLKRAYSKTHSSKAAKYVGLAGCKSGKKSWAKWAYSRLGGGTKKLIKKLCKKKGINL
jgi:pSer/pThr/pTyr-binding forkhead associated (FHA) protein